MSPAERAALRAHALHLIHSPKPRRTWVAVAAFLAGLLASCALH